MASTAYAVRASIRLRGVTYRNPDAAYTAAALIEDEAEQRASEYRKNGDEGMADTTADRGRADAEKLRTWARQREEYEAEQLAQPDDRPAADDTAPRPGRQASKPASTPARKSSRAGARSTPAGRAFGGQGGAIARRGYQRSGAQAAVRSYAGLGWWIAGATIGVAALTLFLTPRGSRAFADLANISAALVGLVTDPVDPLQAGVIDSYVKRATAPPPPPPRRQQGPFVRPNPNRLPTRAGAAGLV